MCFSMELAAAVSGSVLNSAQDLELMCRRLYLTSLQRPFSYQTLRSRQPCWLVRPSV